MIYFFPHSYLRDRQLDTIRRWPKGDILNPDIVDGRKGKQVSAGYANAGKLGMSWKQKIPLLNIKLRPRNLPQGAVVYVWGALIASGKFIVDLDNPWSLVGYNLRAMPFYRWLIKRVLLSNRCREIRCMSKACRESLGVLFGAKVYGKAKVHYPHMPQAVASVERTSGEICRFLFIGTQFEIKGGEAMLKAFKHIYERRGSCYLDVITHLPEEYNTLIESCKGVTIHDARFSRSDIHARFMKNADVLILPTYVESFGMVALEALSHGLALIATDVYALREMTQDSVNGDLIPPPISIWDGVMPSATYYDLSNIKHRIRVTDTSEFELRLEQAIEHFVVDPAWRLHARQASIRLMEERFLC